MWDFFPIIWNVTVSMGWMNLKILKVEFKYLFKPVINNSLPFPQFEFLHALHDQHKEFPRQQSDQQVLHHGEQLHRMNIAILIVYGKVPKF